MSDTKALDVRSWDVTETLIISSAAAELDCKITALALSDGRIRQTAKRDGKLSRDLRRNKISSGGILVKASVDSVRVETEKGQSKKSCLSLKCNFGDITSPGNDKSQL